MVTYVGPDAEKVPTDRMPRELIDRHPFTTS
jgi:hypothetical protein